MEITIRRKQDGELVFQEDYFLWVGFIVNVLVNLLTDEIFCIIKRNKM